MKIIKPESEDQFDNSPCSIFLAGSIEMDSAEDWQIKVQNQLEDLEVTVYNPRRDSWDSSWEQREKTPEFRHQVNWELDRLDIADIVFMYFSPDTKSPISLLELGILSESGRIIVTCPDGFWRKGNVEVLCTRNDIPLYHTLWEGIEALRTEAQNMIF